MQKILVDDLGRSWCRDRRSKRVYASLDEAWLVAFYCFVTRGIILTPYQCGRAKSGRGRVRIRVITNPWAFELFRSDVGMRKRRYRGCKYWHVTRSTAHVLGAGMGDRVMPSCP